MIEQNKLPYMYGCWVSTLFIISLYIASTSVIADNIMVAPLFENVYNYGINTTATIYITFVSVSEGIVKRSSNHDIARLPVVVMAELALTRPPQRHDPFQQCP